MTPTLLLLHGWGFDGGVWTLLRAALADWDAITWDLGYFGRPDFTLPAEGRPVIAIGHSLGLLWLLQKRPLAWSGLISINGFTRFVSGDDFPDGVAPAQITRLSQSIALDPWSQLSAFRQRCGETAPPPRSLREAVLQASLDDLQRWDCRGQTVDLALCGESDRVVTPAHSRACFASQQMHWHRGGHLLPIEAPGWCADRLRAWWADRQ